MCFPFLAAIPAALGSVASAAAGAVGSVASAVSSIGLGTAASLAGTALSAGGSILGGVQANQQAKAQQAAYDRQATIAAEQGEYEVDRKREEINGVTGQQIALAAGSGFSLDGTPTDLFATTASNGALDIGAIRRNARLQADTYRYQGQLSRINGRNSLAAGILGGADRMLSGVTSLYKSYGATQG